MSRHQGMAQCIPHFYIFSLQNCKKIHLLLLFPCLKKKLLDKKAWQQELDAIRYTASSHERAFSSLLSLGPTWGMASPHWRWIVPAPLTNLADLSQTCPEAPLSIKSRFLQAANQSKPLQPFCLCLYWGLLHLRHMCSFHIFIDCTHQT